MPPDFSGGIVIHRVIFGAARAFVGRESFSAELMNDVGKGLPTYGTLK